jgi:hypothetical protein
MKNLNRIINLILLTTLLVLALFTFTMFTWNRVVNESESFACGTTSMEITKVEVYVSDPLVERGKTLFFGNCKSCHRIDQKLVGPALRYVFNVRDSIWLRKMIVNGNKLKESGDTLAMKLFKEYNEMDHFNFEGLSKEEVDGLMQYLKFESKRSNYPIY